MTYMLSSFSDAVDRKFLVTKSLSKQAKCGTIVHIMGAEKVGQGYLVSYRVTETGQDFTITFNKIKEFTEWARPDNFIARHYESFSNKEIQHYIKVSSRTFVTFCLPFIGGALVVIWALMLIIFGVGVKAIIFGVVLSLVATGIVYYIFKSQKSKVKLNMYSKVSSNWGVSFK